LTKQDTGLGVPENRAYVINKTKNKETNWWLGWV
jgi:hypothetical protein